VGYAEYGTDGLTAKSYKGTLQTPALEKVTGDVVNLSFKAMAFKSSRVGRKNMHNQLSEKSSDATDIEIEILDGGYIVELDGEIIPEVSKLAVSGLPVTEFKTFNLKLTGVTPQTKIVFKSAESADFARWFIDDIIVTE
jgi:hypothetical protein